MKYITVPKDMTLEQIEVMLGHKLNIFTITPLGNGKIEIAYTEGRKL